MTKIEAARLVEQFEAGTLPKEQFTHEAHFITAAWYCLNNPLPDAISKIRNGIKTFNIQVGGQNTDTAGYHETITLFYAMTIARYLIATGTKELTDETVSDLLEQPFTEKAYVHKFYTTETLMSVQARRHWTEADTNPYQPDTYPYQPHTHPNRH